MKEQTLIFIIQNGEVLLGWKKRGFGINTWNGYGGKVKKLESPEMCIIRELQEESGLNVNIKDLIYLGFVQFFQNNENRKVYIYTTGVVTGDLIETDEMIPQWFKLTEIPYGQMLSDACYWVPYVISGTYFEGTFYLNENKDIVSKNIKIKYSRICC